MDATELAFEEGEKERKVADKMQAERDFALRSCMNVESAIRQKSRHLERCMRPFFVGKACTMHPCTLMGGRSRT